MAPEGIEWITDERRLAALAPAWDRLARKHDPTPFARHGWFWCWWKAYGKGRQLRVCALWREGALVGVLPLTRVGRRLEGPNVEAPIFRPVAADGEALRGLAQAVVDAAGSELVVPSLPVDDLAVGTFLNAAERRAVRACRSP